jgi:hypothetical protein
MRRNARISCRTTAKVRKGLEEFAVKEGRSLSSALELILTGFFKGHHVLRDASDKRRYGRRSLSVPALVKAADSPASALDSAVILDISLGGMCISVPEETKSIIGSERGNGCFEAAFVLPHVHKPVRLLCKRERVAASDGDLHIGASFIGGDLGYYQQLQQYLLQ